MSTDNYRLQLSKYSRMPYEIFLFSLYLFLISMSFQGLFSTILSVISGFFFLVWLPITYYVARYPRSVRGFVLLQGYILGGLLITAIFLFIILGLSGGLVDAFLTITGMFVLGILLTKLVIFLIRSIFGISQ